MKNAKSILITISSISIVLLHLCVGHYFAPKGIDLLLVTMPLITVLIFQFTNYRVYLKILLVALLFLLLDVGIKLYAGGSHDLEGLDWMNSFYFFGLIIALVIIVYNIIRSSEINLRAKILTIVLFLIFQYIQNNIFWNLGLGRFYEIN